MKFTKYSKDLMRTEGRPRVKERDQGEEGGEALGKETDQNTLLCCVHI